MSLQEANWCPDAAVMLNNGHEITNERKAELKGLFLEGLIRFLDIYAQSEIGEGIQIDIAKIALHINSPSFENDDLYVIKDIYDVYRLLESLTISGLPIWRFLRLSSYQSDMLERQYDAFRIVAREEIAKTYPCYKCVWLDIIDTPLGRLERCNKSIFFRERSMERRGYFDPTTITKCDYLTTLDTIPKKAQGKDVSLFLIKDIERARESYHQKILKDDFRIPKTLDSKAMVDLDTTYDAFENLGCAIRNERTKTERQEELRKAMYVEGMIRFFELYAKCELGSSFVANIKEISMYVDDLCSEDISHIKSFADVYEDLEEKIIDGFDVKKFVKFDEELEVM